MKNEHAEFEQFIQWFASLENLPLQKRHDFLEHLLKTKKFDEQAIEFMEATFNQMEQASIKRQEQWHDLLESSQNAVTIQKKSEFSLTKKLAVGVCGWMKDKAQIAKDAFKKAEASVAQAQEATENQSEAAQVAALKASL